MGDDHVEARGETPRSFEDSRIIDVADDAAIHFWSERLGVTEDEILEAIRLVGPNSTAVALKLEAPREERVSTPIPR
jgi:hypothetical protein